MANHDPGEREKMQPVSASHPCPVCKKKDWCLIAPDGTAAICQRVESAKRCGDAGWLHRLVEPVSSPPTAKPKATAKPKDWPAEAAKYAANMDADHRVTLAESLILPAESLDALPLLGFIPNDRNGPCFIFPEVDATGTVIGLNRRFADKSKKTIAGGKRGLTLPVGWREKPGPVFVVEGPTDATAMTAAGLSAVGRPSNSGDVSLLAELFASDPDREILIVGEYDAKESGEWPGRSGAESVARRLAARLRRPVRWTLPPAGAKDVRDWLTATGRGETAWPDRGVELRTHLTTNAVAPDGGDVPGMADSEKTPIDAEQFSDSGYTVDRGNTCHCVLGRDKDSGELEIIKKTKLANFSAKIVGEAISDDGAEQTREFAVTVKQCNRPQATANIPVERFGTLDWIVERFGPRYVIQAGSGKRDHLRCAIQEMSSDDIHSKTVYRHTGWREIDGLWCYLHGDGAIVPTIPTVPAFPQVEVKLDGAASSFIFAASARHDLRDAVTASLGMLNGLVSDTVAFPLFATVYRTAMGSPDYSVWLTGPTGAQKSELAALAQQHYGAGMIRNRLPGNWSSTDNSLEGLAFTIKDAVLVIDDFAPSTSRNDADRQHRAAERLIRGQGNHSGRQRMRADGTLRPPKPPRGLILATGEDVPRGHSITARLCVVDVQKGSVDLRRLSECQRHAADGLYAAAMAGFIGWLAPQYAEVQARLDAERVELRNQFVGMYPHARTPDTIANLLIGLRYLLKFAESRGAITRIEREQLWRRGQSALRIVAEQQGEHQRAADPVARFPEMLAAIVTSGRGHIAGADGKEPGIPPCPEAWGWQGREYRSGTGETNLSYYAQGNKIGWTVGDELYLDPDSTYAALVELARDQGQAFPVTSQTLYRRLKEAGLLIRFEPDRTMYPITLEGKRHRVLILAASTLLGKPGQSGQSGYVPENAEGNVPVSCPDLPNCAATSGQETGTNTPEETALFPTVPVVPPSGTGGESGKPRRRYRSDERPHDSRG